MRNRPKYLAHKLHEALNNDDGVNYGALSRLLNTCEKVRRRNISSEREKGE